MYPNLFLIIYLLIGVLMVLYDIGHVQKRAYSKMFQIVYTVLALLVAFRYMTGNDTPNYMFQYDYIPPIYDLDLATFVLVRAQPLYTVFVSLCKTVYGDFVFVQIVQAFLFFHSFYLLLGRLDIRKFYILFLFYGYVYLAEMSALRESLGLAFCFYALLYYLKGNLKGYYLLVTAGFFLHSGMIIFFLMPTVRLLKDLSIKNVIIIFLSTLIVPMLYLKFASLGISIGDNSINRYANEDGGTQGFKLTTAIYTFLQLALFVYYLVVKKSKGRPDFIYLGGVFYVMLVLVGSAFLPIFYRFTSHFAVFFYYAISELFKNIKKSPMIIAFAYLIFASSSLLKFTAGLGENGMIYCSVFSSETDKRAMKRLMEADKSSDSFNKE